jgi:hypothetical protein
MRGQTTCAIHVSPGVVEAGAEMTLQGKVSCSPACDLRGHTLLIKDEAGADACSVELTEFDGKTNDTRELVVKAPARPGGYLWSAVCPAVVKGDTSYPEASTPISFTVTPHTINVVVWDIPSAIVAGERFRIKVGMKCSNECDLANSPFGIYDNGLQGSEDQGSGIGDQGSREGRRVATGTLTGDHWPGTTGLYVAEIELESPAAEGLYTWSVKSLGSEAEIPHAEGFVSFGVRVVSHPQYVVTVETVDKDKQTPLKGARVVMHPYKAVTDERGIAEVRVAKGAYKLFVSQSRYLTFGLPVEVDADMIARAELDLEPVPERN